MASGLREWYDCGMPSPSTITEADILSEVVSPDRPGISPEFARSILELRFSDRANKRIRQLLDKNNKGTISEAEREEFLSWLADFEIERADDWDKKIARDSQPGGRLERVLGRVRKDIAEGRTKPLDEVLDNS